MFKIVFFAPHSCKELVKTAMFAAGAGTLGNYDCCSFEVKGTGQFRPLAGSGPFIGKIDQLELVDEYRVEMLCSDAKLDAVISAMLAAHEYEEPAYDIIKLWKAGNHD